MAVMYSFDDRWVSIAAQISVCELYPHGWTLYSLAEVHNTEFHQNLLRSLTIIIYRSESSRDANIFYYHGAEFECFRIMHGDPVDCIKYLRITSYSGFRRYYRLVSQTWDEKDEGRIQIVYELAGLPGEPSYLDSLL